MITSGLLIILSMVHRIVIKDDGLSELDILLQKSLRYKHHKENYLHSIENRIVPSGLKINKKPAFLLISDDFTDQCNKILLNAEEKLVNLLLVESNRVINNLQEKIEGKLYEKYGNDTENRLWDLEYKHINYKKKLKQKRNKKWSKIKNLEKNSPNLEETYIKKASEDEKQVQALEKINTDSNIQTIPEQLITDNRLWRRKRTKVNETISKGISEYNNVSLAEKKTLDKATYADVVRNSPSPSKSKIDFRDIYFDLLKDEAKNDSKIEISPPSICTSSAETQNSSHSFDQSAADTEYFTSQDRELISILEELQNNTVTASQNSTETTRLAGHFCSDTVFNLSNRVLTDAGISVLEKGLDYAPIQNKINEPELRTDFEEFCRKMRLKWHFRNDTTSNFSEIPAFRPKSTWNPPKRAPKFGSVFK